MSTQLSAGAIVEMNDEEKADSVVDPVLQVLSIKKVSSTQAQDRYRLIVSDGVNFMQAMMATHLNHMLTGDSPDVVRNTIIKLTSYACNIVQGRRIVICLTAEAVAQPDDKIGNPVSLGGEATAAAPANAAPTSAPPAKAAPAPKKPAARTAAKGAPKAALYPIDGLSPYQNKWSIKARVTSKSEIRHWTNAKGEGKLFSVNLLDDSGEIKATGFNDAVDNFYNLFEEGKVYYISKARVNIAKKQFSNLASEYEITFENSSEVELCEDQDGAPQIKYAFVPLSSLSDLEKDVTCDVLGIVTNNGQLSEITAKASGKQIKKRELMVCDSSGYEVRVTLWGKGAESWTDSDNGVYAFKGAKVGDFGGRTLSMGGQSTMSADPDIAEAHQLRGWYDTTGQTTTFKSHSAEGGGGGAGAGSFKKDAFITLEAAQDGQIGMSEKPDYFSTRATVSFTKPENLSYPACPTDRCNKKVSMEGDNMWRCEKCDLTHEAPEYRYILSFCVADYTSQIWLSGFNEIGAQLFGRTADEMEVLKDTDNDLFLRIIKEPVGKVFNFNIKAKADSYQDQMKVRYQVMRFVKVDWVEGAKDMLAQIAAY